MKDYFAIILSLIFALSVSMFPLPKMLFWLQPNWPLLVLIYWITFMPNRIGVFSGFCLGLIIDLLHGGFIGSMALTLSIVAFMTTLLRFRLRMMNLGAQLMVILVLVGFQQLINLWIQLLFGEAPISFVYWVPTLISVMVWPFLYVLLQSYQRNLKLI